MHNPSQRLNRVRSALYGIPWAILPERLEAICEIFERHINAEKLEAEFEIMTKAAIAGGSDRRYQVLNGTAIIPLMGPIFPRSNMMTQMSGATSIEQFGNDFAQALTDKDVSSVLLQIDSPGGSVLGLFEAAQKVFDARGQSKPIIALADGMAASAAYAVGSQADEFYTTDGAVVGSIGVVSALQDSTRMEKNIGIDTEYFKSGPLKAAGVGPVTEDQKAAMKRIVGEYFDKFKMAVSRSRPMADLEKVATGDVWIGGKAVGMGLVDGVSGMDALLARMANG